MTWTCALHPSDLYVAYLAGLLAGLTVGIWGGIELHRRIEIRKVQSHSQFPHEEAE